MKKIFILLAFGYAMMAHADAYNYLVFTNQAGTTTAFEVCNLTLKANGNELQVSNADGTVDLVLTELASMQFSVDKAATGVEDVLNADSLVQVYTVTGTLLGTYHSMVEAAKCMSTGTYVVASGNQTQTVVIK